MFRSAADLYDYLEISQENRKKLLLQHENFPVRVTRAYAARIRKNDIHDPLFLQVAPQRAELETLPGYHTEPLEESDYVIEPGVLQKYQGRALLVTTGACAIHCRYCFRRNFPYQEHRLNQQRWQQQIGNLAGDPGIREVILSGGDPLMLSNQALADMIGHVEQLSQVSTLRLHTRLPIVLPTRIDQGLLDTLAASSLDIVVVIHSNHANELDDSVAKALRDLALVSTAMLNQAVLLADVNDNVKALTELNQRYFSEGVLPYYLHLLDKVSGTHQFAVPVQRAKALVEALRQQLPGYLVPKLVTEAPGHASKLPL